ncbi:MAG: hypothetical protein J6B51_07670, partial [Clostridia bacterium]|nr:hypothetical protein [Clostridia bacterium]
MECIKDFKIVFTAEDGTETVASDLEKHEQNGYIYYSTKFDDLIVSVLLNDENELCLRARNAGNRSV